MKNLHKNTISRKNINNHRKLTVQHISKTIRTFKTA